MAEQSTIAVYPLDGTNRKFVVPYEYLARRFVTVTLLGTDRKPLVLGTDFRFISANQIETTQAWGDTQGYANIEVRRKTSATQRLVDFYDGSVLRSRDLNVSAIQTIHIAEEARNLAAYTLATDDDGNLDARGRRLVNLGDAVSPKDALTLDQVMGWSQSALNQANRSQAEADKSAASAAASAMMARGAVVADSIADLLALPEGQRKEDLRYLVKGYHAGSDVGGGEFYWDASSTAMTDYGLVFSAVGASTGRFHRLVFNNTVSFFDFGCKADGSDETVRVQATLNAPYNITSARDQTYTTSATLFNQVPNRTVDFNWSRIRNKTNATYAIVTVSEALPEQTDAALRAFWAELHYDEQIENSHVKNVLVDMSPNTGSGANLGIGITYGRNCSIIGFVIENTNGNGYEIRHSYRCRAQNGKVVGARSYGSFNYMTKDCSSVNVHIKGVARAGIVKHAYYDDPNVNYTFKNCIFESIRLKGVAGGSSAETGSSPAQQPIGHEIVRGVKVLDCDFITHVGDEAMSSVEAGGHADSWVIEGNRFYVPVGYRASGFALNIGGEFTSGFFVGGQHVIARNKFYGGDYADAVVTNSSSMHAMDNEFHDVQGLKAFNFGGSLDGGHSSIRGTKGTFKLLGGGQDVISGGFIAIREGNVSPVISGNTLNITGVANAGARRTLSFVQASPLTKAKIQGNSITINLTDAYSNTVRGMSATNCHVSGNTLTVNSSVAGSTIIGIFATTGGGVFCGDNDLILNDTGGAAGSAALRVASGSIIGTNRYTGWAVDEQILP